MSTGVAKQEEKKENGGVSKRHEYPMISSFQRDLNRLFDDFTRGFGFTEPVLFEPISDFNAKLDMKDNEKEIVVSVELPGVDMKDINVSLKDKTLSVKGEKHSEKEEKAKGYYRKERSYGSFHRVMPLPCAVEKDQVSALYKDGVLTITMPKTKEAVHNERQISVKAGS